ncbi:MAG TPA: nitrogenase component 1 [Methanoregulaceae archaeon]|nr:nitrogenase component 1 [Methanoregulaceae archaeon]
MSSSRSEGCTLTGALSVTTAVKDAVTIIHGPAGCAHHNFSLLHALEQENDYSRVPGIVCTNLREGEVIFGGEEALERLIRKTANKSPGSVFVLSTCVVDTIGDDLPAVCAQDYGVPVCYIPTSGFLGGVFHTGYENALQTLSEFSNKGEQTGGVTLIGEKNLEFEVDQNFQEVSRLLSLLGIEVQLRYVRNISSSRLADLGKGSLNILRDSSIQRLGEKFHSMFGTPFLDSFPAGFGGTIQFLLDVGEILGIDSSKAVFTEEHFQKKVISKFQDLKGSVVSFTGQSLYADDSPVMDEMIEIFDFSPDEKGMEFIVPDPIPVGTSGISRLLHRWRRSSHARA